MCHNSKNNNPLLIIVGMCGAGKSSIANYLKLKGWQVIRFGEITIYELNARDLPHSEVNERAIREELRKVHGADVYAIRLLPRIKEALMVGPTVIDGLYSWREYRFLRQKIRNQMNVVTVFSTRSIRYERLARRTVRPLSSEEAELRDSTEIENIEKDF